MGRTVMTCCSIIILNAEVLYQLLKYTCAHNFLYITMNFRAFRQIQEQDVHIKLEIFEDETAYAQLIETQTNEVLFWKYLETNPLHNTLG